MNQLTTNDDADQLIKKLQAIRHHRLQLLQGLDIFIERLDKAMSRVEDMAAEVLPLEQDQPVEEPAPAKAKDTQQSQPLCAVHKKRMVWRVKDGDGWWSCATRNQDNSWCNYRPDRK